MDRVVQSSGTEWRYHLVGEGNQCLVVLSGSLGATNRIAGFLAEQLTDYRFIVPEYAAVGTIRECLDALDLILDREKIERFALLGSSFGGVIAQVFARRHPDRVTNLILAGTSPPDMDRVRSHQRALKLLPWIPVSLIRALLKILLHGMLRRVKNRVWLQEYSRLISSLSKKDISSRYRVAMDLDRSYRFDPQDLYSSIPVLILEGERDRIANQTTRLRWGTIYPHANFHVFRGAGHSAMMTHTEEWIHVVRAALIS